MATEKSIHPDSDVSFGDILAGDADLSRFWKTEEPQPDEETPKDDNIKEETAKESLPEEVPSKEVETEEVEEPKEDSEEKEPEKEEETPEEEEPKPDKVQKRIDKLTARAKGAEEALEALKQEFATLKEAKAEPKQESKPNSSSPLLEVETHDELQQKMIEARDLKKWALRNPDGGTIQGSDGKEVFIEPEKAKDILVWADEMLTEHIPARAKFIQDHAAFQSEVQKEHPNLLKKGTEEHNIMLAYAKLLPEIKKFPDWQMIVGDAIAYSKIRASKAKAKPAVAPSKAPPAPKPGNSTPQKVKTPTKLSTRADDIDALINSIV